MMIFWFIVVFIAGLCWGLGISALLTAGKLSDLESELLGYKMRYKNLLNSYYEEKWGDDSGN